MKNGVIRPNAVRWTGLYEGTGCALPFEVRCGQVRGLILGAPPETCGNFISISSNVSNALNC
jgi:hypothetical protein